MEEQTGTTPRHHPVVAALRRELEATHQLVELAKREQCCLLQSQADRLEGIGRRKASWMQALAASQRDLERALSEALGTEATEGTVAADEQLGRLPEPPKSEALHLLHSLQSTALRLAHLSRTNMMLLGYGIGEARRVSAALSGTAPERSTYDARGTIVANVPPTAPSLGREA